MANPGLYLDSFYVPGLIEDIQWGQWGRPVQRTTQFGLTGETIIDGLRTGRPFTCPMLIFNGFVSFVARESFLQSLEGQIGRVVQLTQVDMDGNVLRHASGIEFVDFVRGMDRADPDIGYWCKGNMMFRQLAPSAVVADEDEGD